MSDFVQQTLQKAALHLHFMPPQAKKTAAAHMDYAFYASPFGHLCIANTPLGVCYQGFAAAQGEDLSDLKKHFPQSKLHARQTALQQQAYAAIFAPKPAVLHLFASEFQKQVWLALLDIPFGKTKTYGEIAAQIDRRKAARAVGNAVGQNPIAPLIPCHRVLPASGEIGGYGFGRAYKMALLAYEQHAAPMFPPQ